MSESKTAREYLQETGGVPEGVKNAAIPRPFSDPPLGMNGHRPPDTGGLKDDPRAQTTHEPASVKGEQGWPFDENGQRKTAAGVDGPPTWPVGAPIQTSPVLHPSPALDWRQNPAPLSEGQDEKSIMQRMEAFKDNHPLSVDEVFAGQPECEQGTTLRGDLYEGVVLGAKGDPSEGATRGEWMDALQQPNSISEDLDRAMEEGRLELCSATIIDRGAQEVPPHTEADAPPESKRVGVPNFLPNPIRQNPHMATAGAPYECNELDVDPSSVPESNSFFYDDPTVADGDRGPATPTDDLQRECDAFRQQLVELQWVQNELLRQLSEERIFHSAHRELFEMGMNNLRLCIQRLKKIRPHKLAQEPTSPPEGTDRP